MKMIRSRARADSTLHCQGCWSSFFNLLNNFYISDIHTLNITPLICLMTGPLVFLRCFGLFELTCQAPCSTFWNINKHQTPLGFAFSLKQKMFPRKKLSFNRTCKKSLCVVCEIVWGLGIVQILIQPHLEALLPL